MPARCCPWYLTNVCESLRCKALTEQNNVLHQHLDNVSSQAARIRQAADSSVGTPGEAETADGTEVKLSELRAVINYLRKEKEIVDMQLELCKQENARLKTQIGHVTRDLEDTRATLSDVGLCYPASDSTVPDLLFFRSESVPPLQPQRTRSTRNWSRRSSN
jgi:5-bromo-4-chloroindolyl phosphate hydrolysis protein